MVRSRQPKIFGTGVEEDADMALALRPTLDRLDEFADLQPDWDSYGGHPPSSDAIVMARRVAEGVAGSLAPIAGDDAFPRAVSPLADGGVQLAWQRMDRLAEIDIDVDGRLGYLLREGTGTTICYEEDDDISRSEVIALVRRVLSR